MKTRWNIAPLLALVCLMAPLAGAAPKPAPKKPVSKTAAKKPATKPKPKSAIKKSATKPKPKPRATPRPWATPLPVRTPAAARTPLAEKTPLVVKTPEPEPTEAAPKYQTWALLVGISKYAAPQVASLNFPAADATGIRDALVDKKLGNVPAQNIKLLTNENATGAAILGAVDDFLKPNVKAGDHVIVFLAGHGVAKGVGANAKSYLLPTDVRGLSTAALDASAVNLRVLADKLSALPAAQFVQFVDACREDPTPGRAGKGNALTDIMSRGVHVEPRDDKASSVTFFACSIGQRAFEDPKFEHGVFTYWILDGIREAAVPQAPDGAIDMGRLSGFVSEKVGDWAKQASNNGDFEIAQTPEMIASQPDTDADPVILMRVSRPLSASPIAPEPPQLSVITFPEGARVSVDGQNAGAAPLTRVLASGTHKVKIEAAGYETAERDVRLMDGYPQQVVFQLKPQGRGLAGAAEATNASFARALDAETRQQWEVAEAGYRSVIAADAKFAPAYERLADLQSRQGRHRDALNTLLTMGSQTSATAHAYSLLSQAFSAFALRGAGDGNTDARRLSVGPFKTPNTPQDAANFARGAANAAIKADANSAEANRALGFALIATDKKGANKSAALAALGKAAFLDDKDATNFYALGYGIRFFAAPQNGDVQKGELQRAISTLNQALALRPEYYEAHRELAYCHHLLGDEDAAIAEYELANANRGAARDKNEVAGNSVALSSLHQEKAQNSSGEEKQRETEASGAYLDEARETSGGDLKLAVGVLSLAGLSTHIRDYLPPEVTRILNLPTTLEGEVRDKIRDKIRIPGGGRLPF